MPDHTPAGGRGRRKAPAGEDRGFCGLPACRSDRPMCIVGGHNDAASRMRLFYRNCNSNWRQLTTNCANALMTYQSVPPAPKPTTVMVETPSCRGQIYRTHSTGKLMLFRLWIASLLIASGTFSVAAAEQTDSVAAVAPGGPGILTKCRNWLVASSCRTYHHINLPSRVTVGDMLTVSFGSRPKEYRLSVARIALQGQHCAIFSKAEGDPHRMDKIDVAPCYRAEEGR
jgi:hypothetical protein